MNRREFLMSAGAVAVVGCTTVKGGSGCADKPQRNVKFRLGVAGFTYYKFKLDETLADLKRFGVHELCAKQFHYPMDAKPDELMRGAKKALFTEKCDAWGWEAAIDLTNALTQATAVRTPCSSTASSSGAFRSRPMRPSGSSRFSR